jgi:hypothetical protein
MKEELGGIQDPVSQCAPWDPFVGYSVFV